MNERESVMLQRDILTDIILELEEECKDKKDRLNALNKRIWKLEEGDDRN